MRIWKDDELKKMEEASKQKPFMDKTKLPKEVRGFIEESREVVHPERLHHPVPSVDNMQVWRGTKTPPALEEEEQGEILEEVVEDGLDLSEYLPAPPQKRYRISDSLKEKIRSRNKQI
jgi:hypothetical protein